MSNMFNNVLGYILQQTVKFEDRELIKVSRAETKMLDGRTIGILKTYSRWLALLLRVGGAD